MAPRTWQWLMLVLAAPLPAFAQAQPTFTAKLVASEIATDGRAVVVIDVSWVEVAGRSLRVLTPRAPSPKNLELENVATEITSAPAPDGTHHRVRLTCAFKPLEPGDAETGPIEVRYLSTDLAQIVSGHGVNADGRQHFTHTVKSMSVYVANRSRTVLLIVLAALALVLVAASVAIVAALVKQSKTPAAEPALDAAASAEKAALDRLHALRTLRIEGDTKGYVGRVAELLSQYVADKFGADAADAAALAAHLDEHAARRLAELVERAEKIQYAGDPPTDDELNRIAAFAEDLLRKQMPDADVDLRSKIRMKE